MIAIEIGAMLMALGAQNRAQTESDKRRMGTVFIIAASVIVLMVDIMITEYAAFANNFHGSRFYLVTGMLLPLYMVAFARSSRLTWPATRIAIIYMLLMMISIWVLEAVPATPKLAPIYNPVTRMVPPAFPLLLFAPALAIDVLLKRWGTTRDWTLAIALGVSFVAVMVAVHWFWADFMLSPSARNYFFGADRWDYVSQPGPWRYRYWNLDVDGEGKWSAVKFSKGMLIAVVLAILSSRLGLVWGKGMSKVKR
jgi:hypothetical protein